MLGGQFVTSQVQYLFPGPLMIIYRQPLPLTRLLSPFHGHTRIKREPDLIGKPRLNSGAVIFVVVVVVVVAVVVI